MGPFTFMFQLGSANEVPRDGKARESGQSIDLPLPFFQVPMEASIPLPKATAPVTIFPKPLPLFIPSGFRVVMVTSLKYCSIHYYFSYSLSTLCVKFLS